jgi:hypothetical protein
MKYFIILQLLECMLLSSCISITGIIPPDTIIIPTTTEPFKTKTITPTITISPTITNTETPIFIPTGEPLKYWKDIPIMPGATSGKIIGYYYYFAIRTTPKNIKTYYVLELGNRGWHEQPALVFDPKSQTYFAFTTKGPKIVFFIIEYQNTYSVVLIKYLY